MTRHNHNRRDTVRARMEQTGESYTTALRALENSGEQPAPEPAPAVDWSPLHGVEVTFTPSAGGPVWRGVVLPPAGDTPIGRLRVSVTHRPKGKKAPTHGELTVIDPADWVFNPTPGKVHDRYKPSRRQTTGQKGLPLYRADNLPTLALASRSMLRRQFRREPGPDQKPIAEYYQMTDYSNLFAIADAVALPPLPPGRQAAWDQVRTCARCGSRHLDPVPVLHRYEQRYCTSCREPAAKDHWEADRQVERTAVTAWAQEVLADPDGVWIHSGWGAVAPLFVARISDGTVLADLAKVYLGAEEDRRYYRDPTELEGSVERGEAEPLITGLVGSRLVGWDSQAEAMLISLRHHGTPGLDDLKMASGDYFGERYARWLGIPTVDGDFYAQQPPYVMAVVAPAAGAEQFREAMTVLREMAAGGPGAERCATARANRDNRSYYSTHTRP